LSDEEKLEEVFMLEKIAHGIRRLRQNQNRLRKMSRKSEPSRLFNP